MLDSLKNLVQSGRLRNPGGLPRELLLLMAEDFAALAQAREDLPERTLRFVVDGDDPAAPLSQRHREHPMVGAHVGHRTLRRDERQQGLKPRG
jgi:hypothetical protein